MSGKRRLPLLLLAALLVLGWALTPAALAAGEITVTGLFQDSKDGPVLKAGSTTYLLQGDIPDFLLGKKIKATGRVEKDAAGNLYLIVASFQESAG